MSAPVLVCRPEPGATATAGAARALGLAPVTAPLFRIEPLAWEPPAPEGFDALVMTSANAARNAGPALGRYHALPGFAVGEATAAAMRRAGLRDIVAGDRDAEALTTLLAGGSFRRLLHLCGEHHRAPVRADLAVLSVPVYRAVAAPTLPPAAREALAAGAAVLLHSPRAAALFARLADAAGLARARIRLVAISPAAAAAAGPGWASVEAAPAPADGAMLAIAGKLCESRWR